MQAPVAPHPNVVADALFRLLDPIPFGCFVAAMIFDIAYARTAEILWTKAAAWLLVIGLFAAIVPRLLNLVHVWGPSRRFVGPSMRVAFWLNLLAIVAAIFNAFVHSRDAYAVVPTGQWLSVITVVLIGLGHIMRAVGDTRGERRHD